MKPRKKTSTTACSLNRPPHEEDQFVKNVVELYDMRSLIVHEARITKAEVAAGCNQARLAVGEILRAEFNAGVK